MIVLPMIVFPMLVLVVVMFLNNAPRERCDDRRHDNQDEQTSVHFVHPCFHRLIPLLRVNGIFIGKRPASGSRPISLLATLCVLIVYRKPQSTIRKRTFYFGLAIRNS